MLSLFVKIKDNFILVLKSLNSITGREDAIEFYKREPSNRAHSSETIPPAKFPSLIFRKDSSRRCRELDFAQDLSRESLSQWRMQFAICARQVASDVGTSRAIKTAPSSQG